MHPDYENGKEKLKQKGVEKDINNSSQKGGG